MAETITTAEVIAAYPAAANLPDYLLQAYIDQMDGADACLDALSLTSSQEKALKLTGVLHILTLSQRGGIASESTKTGASRSYFDSDSINSTSYGKALQSMAGSECLLAKISSDSRVFVGSIKGLS